MRIDANLSRVVSGCNTTWRTTPPESAPRRARIHERPASSQDRPKRKRQKLWRIRYRDSGGHGMFEETYGFSNLIIHFFKPRAGFEAPVTAVSPRVMQGQPRPPIVSGRAGWSVCGGLVADSIPCRFAFRSSRNGTAPAAVYHLVRVGSRTCLGHDSPSLQEHVRSVCAEPCGACRRLDRWW